MQTGRGEVFITVVKAHLTKSFERFGKMSPYATVEWDDGGGGAGKTKIAVTDTHSFSHFTPVWNYVCKSQSCFPDGNGCSVTFRVYDKEPVGRDDYCGCGEMMVGDLLSSPEGSPYHEVPIRLKNEQTGVCYVQATFVPVRIMNYSEKKNALVDPSCFVSPVMSIDGAGNSPIYTLKLKNHKASQSPYRFIGKDVTFCEDEVPFYENMLSERRNKDVANKCYHGLLNYAFPYLGILSTREFPDGPPLDLIVIKNINDGCKKLRVLELKIITKADGSIRNSIVRRATSSPAQGFRLEKFGNMPESLHSMDPTLDVGMLLKSLSLRDSEKKERKKHLQRLNGADIFTYFLDLHKTTFENVTGDVNDYLCAEEYSEFVLNEIVRRLARLSVICHKVILPQKWVGTSIVLGFDAGTIPPRNTSKSTVRSSILVHNFDWGGSDLNTLETNKAMDPASHKKYSKVWRDYVAGIDRLSWNAARYYFNRYGNTIEWKTINITLYDYDTMKADDRMGETFIKVKETETTTFTVTNGNKKVGTLECSLTWVPFPGNGRLQGIWRLFIIRANGLPNLDAGGVSDPYCIVKTMSAYGHEFCQYSCVRENTLNPVWNEIFDIPVMKKGSTYLHSTLEAAGGGVGYGDLEDLFTGMDIEDGYEEWTERVTVAYLVNDKER